MVRITVVYDNNAYDAALQTAWGFSALVETTAATVLFDTGGDAPTLLSNMAALGIDPHTIDAIALSHIHRDHTGGLAGLLDTGIRPTVYAPAAFPTDFKNTVSARTDMVEVTGPMQIAPGIHVTGEVGTDIVEQALVVETTDGLVVVCGCAHPGVVEMTRRAAESVGTQIALVMGGFHLGQATQAQISRTIDGLNALNVQRVAPSHCTGDPARQAFSAAFGENYVLIGAGAVLDLER